jgi:hypothetical protein
MSCEDQSERGHYHLAFALSRRNTLGSISACAKDSFAILGRTLISLIA